MSILGIYHTLSRLCTNPSVIVLSTWENVEKAPVVLAKSTPSGSAGLVSIGRYTLPARKGKGNTRARQRPESPSIAAVGI